MATATWVAANAGDWATASNWDGDFVPGSSTDVTIAAAGSPYTVTVDANEAANSVTLDASGATLAIDATLTVNAGVSLEAGTLALASNGILGRGVLTITGGTVAAQGGELLGTTIDGNIGLAASNASLTLAGDTTLNGTISVSGYAAALALAADSAGSFQTTLGGSGEIDVGNASGDAFIYADNSSGDVFGPGLVIHQTDRYAEIGTFSNGPGVDNKGTIVGDYNGGQLIIDQNGFINDGTLEILNGDTSTIAATVDGLTNTATGTIDVSGAGSSLIINAGTQDVTFHGAVTVALGGTLTLYGSYTTADLSHITNNHGTVILDGLLQNSGTGFTATPTSQVVIGGIVDGGTITDTGGLSLQANPTLNAVTYIGPGLTQSISQGDVNIAGSLALFKPDGTTPGTLVMSSYDNHLGVIGSTTITAGSITVGSSGQYYSYLQIFGITGTPTPLLTLDAGVTLVDDANYGEFTGGAIDNKGTIQIASSFGTFTDATGIDNENLFEASNGVTTYLENFFNFGTAIFNGTTTHGELGYNVTPWQNSGTIDVTGGAYLYLDGSLGTTSAVGMNNTGGVVLLNGTYINNGATLNADTGPFGVLGLGPSGVLGGGTLLDPNGLMVFQGGTLNGVTYKGILDLAQYNATVVVENATATSFQAADGSLPGTINITGDFAFLEVAGTETIDNVTINIDPAVYYYEAGISVYTGALLTLGPNVIINEGGPQVNIVSNGSIDFKGTLNANYKGGVVYIDSYNQPFTNDGSILVSNNSEVFDEYGFINTATGTISVSGESTFVLDQYGSAWSNAGSISITTGSTLVLGGTFTAAGAGAITNDGGYVRIEGTLQNAGETYTVGAGIVSNFITLYSGGEIQGGVLHDPGNQMVYASGTLAAVTDDTSLNLGANQNVYISGGIRMSGADKSINLANGAGLYFTGTTSLDNMTVNLHTNDTVDLPDFGTPSLGPNFRLNLHGGNDTINLQGGLTTNQGVIAAEQAGGNLTISANGALENENSIRVDSGSTLTIDSVVLNDLGANILVTGAGSSLTLGSAQTGVYTNPYVYYPYYMYPEYQVPPYNQPEILQTLLSDWTNDGTITVANGASLYLGGDFTDAALAGIVNHGGTVFISGTLENAGSMLMVGAGTSLGRVELAGGVINGGTVDSTDGALLNNGGTLDGVTYTGPVTVDASNATVTIENGLTETGVLGPALYSLIGFDATLSFAGTQTLDNAVVTLGASDWLGSAQVFAGPTPPLVSSQGGYSEVSQYYGAFASADLTLGPDAVVIQNGQTSGMTSQGALVNDGTIVAGYVGGQFIINAPTFTNNGIIVIDSGDELTINVSDFNSPGTIQVASGATLDLNFTYYPYAAENIGGIGLLSVGQGSTVELGNNFAYQMPGLLQVGEITVELNGRFDNFFNTLSIYGGDLILQSSGIIQDSTIQDPPPGVQFQGGTLDTVTYNGLLDLSEDGASLNIANSLTVDQQDGTSPGTIALTGNNATLTFLDAQTFDNAKVLIGGTYDVATLRQQDSYYSGGGGESAEFTTSITGSPPPPPPPSTLVLGQHLTILQTGSYAAVNAGYDYNDTLINDGTIEAAVANAPLSIGGETFTNNGLLLAGNGVFGNGGSITITAGTFTNLANNTLTGGTYDIQSNSTIAISGSVSSIQTLAADVTLDGTNAALLTDGNDMLGSLDEIANGATLSVIDGGGATIANPFTVDGLLRVEGVADGPDGAQTAALNSSGTITIASDGSLVANGIVFAPVADNGQITVDGEEYFNQGATGTGSAVIVPGGIIDTNGTFTPGVTFTGTGTLTLEQSGDFDNGTISGLALGDTLQYNNIGGIDYANLSNGTLDVTVDGADHFYNIVDPASGSLYASITNNQVIITSPPPPPPPALLAQEYNLPNTIDLSPLHIGDTALQPQYVYNNSYGAENLNAGVAFTTGDVSASGTISELAPGQWDNGDLSVGIDALHRGVDYGTVGIAMNSDGTQPGGDGYGPTALPTFTIGVWATVYSLATFTVTPPGVVYEHVGDTTQVPVTITNTALADGYSESLWPTNTTWGGGLTGASGNATIEPGAIDASDYTVAFDTSAPGFVSGGVTYDMQSIGTGNDTLPFTDLGTVNAFFSAEVNNYATADIAAAGGTGVFSGDAVDGYTLDLGTIQQGDSPVQEVLDIENTASGQADQLSGSFVIDGDTSDIVDLNTGGFSGITAGSNFGPLAIALQAINAGTFSQTITLNPSSDNPNSSTPLDPQVITVTGTVTASPDAGEFAVPVVGGGTASVSLGAQRLGAGLSAPVSISNNGPVGGQSLDVDIGGVTGSATANGSISQLAPGANDDSSITVGLNGNYAGVESGTVVLDFQSDPTNTSTALQSQTITVSGTVYNQASAYFEDPPNFIIHVNDTTVPAAHLTVLNTAPAGSYSEGLVAQVIGSAGSILANGQTTLIAAGGTDTADIALNFVSTKTAGVESGLVAATLTSDGTGTSGLAPIVVGTTVFTVYGTINNYATAELVQLAGDGDLAADGAGFKLDFGTVAEGADISANLGVMNSASGQADFLGGSFSNFVEDDGGDAFTNNGFGIFSGYGAGQTYDGSLGIDNSISLDTSKDGTFTETATLVPYGFNSSGYDVTETPIPITITGTVSDLAIAQIGDGTPAAKDLMLDPVRAGTPVDGTVDISNTGPDSGQLLDSSVTSTTGDAFDADTAVDKLAPGATDANGIAYAFDTTDSGQLDGTLVINFQSDDGSGHLTPLPAQTFTATVDSYALADPSAEGAPDAFFHVGDDGETSINVTNQSADGYNEDLLATATSADDGFTLDNTETGPIQAGDTSDAITLTFDTSEAQEINGLIGIDYQSTGAGTDGAAPIDLESGTVDVTATINNYATADLQGYADDGFSGGPTDYVMNLGTIEENTGALYGTIDVLNIAAGPADLLKGTWSYGDGSPFGDDLSSFNGIDAGGEGGGGFVQLSSYDGPGFFSEELQLYAYGYNASGYQDADPQILTVTVEGDVVPSPPPPPPPPPAPPPIPTGPTAGSGGDTHVYTFDGARYDFQAAGEFILAESKTDGFQVQVRLTPASPTSSVSYITAVAVAVGTDKVTYDPTRATPIWVDGTAVASFGSSNVLSLPGGGGTVALDGGQYVVTEATGETVTMSGYNVVVGLGVGAAHNSVEGLLGDYSGNVANDLTDPGGTVFTQPMSSTTLYGAFADAWRLTDADTLLDYGPGQTTETFTDKTFPHAAVTLNAFPSGAVASATAAAVAAGITDPELQQSAVLDYLETNDTTFLTSANNLQQLGVTATTTVPVTSPPPPPTVGILAPVTQETEPSNTGGVTTATFQVYRGGGSTLVDPEVVNWQVVSPDQTYVPASAFASGDLPSGSVTIAAGQATASFNVVLDSGTGIGPVPQATLDVQISTNGGDDSTIVSPGAVVTIVNNTPEPGATPSQAAFQVVSGPGALSQNGNDWTLNLGSYALNAPGGSGEVAVANVATAPADELTGSFTSANDSGFVVNTISLNAKLGASVLSNIVSGGFEDIAGYTFNMSQAGTHTETITLSPVDTNASNYNSAQATQTLTIEYVVVPPAQATVTPTTLDFGSIRAGTAVAQGITVANTGLAGSENLDASIGPITGAATGTGSISALAQGQTDTTDIVVGLSASVGGITSGKVTVDPQSDGAGIDGAGASALVPQTVTVTGTAYALADPSVTPAATIYTHVGQNPNPSIILANDAPTDGYAENLIGSLVADSVSVTNPIVFADLESITSISTSGATPQPPYSTGDIAPGSSAAINLGLPLSSAGTIGGALTLDLISDGTGIDTFGMTDLGQTVVPVVGTIYNYATAGIENLSTDVATLTGGGSAYTLDFGSVAQGTTGESASLGIENLATSGQPGDALSGSIAPTGTEGAFQISSFFDVFTGIAAGGEEDGPFASLNTGTTGVFSQQVTLYGTGSDPGFSGALTPITITVEGTVASATFGPAVATLNSPGPLTLGNQREGGSLSDPLSYSNTATPPAEDLDVSVGGTIGDATATGSISLLAAGSTETNAINVGVDTSSAGAQSGSIVLNEYTDGSGTDGGGKSMISASTVAVSGNVYRTAAPEIGPIDTIVHRGDPDSLPFTVSNTALTDGFSEDLIAHVSGTSGQVTIGTSSTTGDIAPGSDATTLNVGFSSAQDGSITGAVTLALTSDGGTGPGSIDGLGTVALPSQTIAVDVTIDNYATVTLQDGSPDIAGLTFNGDYTLDFGTVAQGTSGESASLDVGNAATGQADVLSGSIVSGPTNGFSISSFFDIFTDLSAGQLTSGPAISLNTGTAGVFSQTFTVESTSSDPDFSGTLAPVTITAVGTVVAPAVATLNTPGPIVLPNQRVGDNPAASEALSFTNSASPPAENLLVGVDSQNGAFAAGSIPGLGAGDTDATGMTVRVANTAAGPRSGNVVLDEWSDGVGIDNNGTTPIGTATIDVSGSVFRPGAPGFGGTDTIVHRGDDVTLPLSVSNTAAADGFSEDLIASVLGASGGFTTGASGPTGDIAPGANDSSLNVGIPTTQDGTITGLVTIALTSDGGTGVGSIDGLGTLALPSETIAATATIYNYATAAIDNVNSAIASMTGGGDAYTLDFGQVAQGTSGETATIDVSNAATGLADVLAGDFSSLNPSGEFTDDGFNPFSGLAAGDSDGGFTIGLDTGTLGAVSQTITLYGTSSDSALSGTLTPVVLTVHGTVISTAVPPAQATLNTPGPITLPNQRVDAAPAASSALSFTNSADAPAERLDVSVATANGAATSNGGSITQLGAGDTDSSSITVGIVNNTAGTLDGNVVLDEFTDGAGIDGNGTAEIGTSTIDVNGSVFREAAANIAVPVDLIVHLGQPGSLTLTVGNTAAADGYSEDLIATITGISGGFGIGSSGPTGDIAAGAQDTSLNVGFATAPAGTITGNVTLGLVSDGGPIDGLGTVALPSQTIAATATVYNYATAAIADLSPSIGALSGSGDAYTLDFGKVALGASGESVSLDVENTAAGPADSLSGSIVGGSGAFSSFFDVFTDISAGGEATGPTIGLDTGTAGVFSQTITLLGTGSDPDFSGTLTPIAITLEGTVYGQAAAILNTPGPITLPNQRINGTASAALSFTNSATAPAEALDVSVTGTASFATSNGGSISLLAPGGTDSSSIAVGVDTSAAGVRGGDVTLLLDTDGTGTDGAPKSLLGTADVSVSGNVYREAAPAVTAPASFITHTGQAVSVSISVANTAAADGYSEDLIGDVVGGSATAGISPTSSTTGDIVASGGGSIGLHVTPTASGMFSGSLNLDLISDGQPIDGLGTVDLGSQTVAVSGTVYNYATAALADIGSVGTFAGSGGSYSLDLGTVTQGSARTAAVLDLQNTASALADTLGGTTALSGQTSAFINSGFGALGPIAAGAASGALDISLSTANTGTFEQMITLTLSSTDPGGSTALTPVTIDVTGTVAAPAGQVFTLTTGPDTVNGTSGVNTVLATGGALSAGDQIAAGANAGNTLVLQGAGIFDLTQPTTLTGVPTIEAQEGQPSSTANGKSYVSAVQTLDLRAGMNGVTVNVAPANVNAGNPKPPTITINGAANNDIINLASGADAVTMGLGETLNGGSGNNTIFVTASTVSDQINGGTGKSTLWFTGGGTAVLGGNITNIGSVYLQAAGSAAYNVTANSIAGMVLQDGATATLDSLTAGGANQVLTGGGAGKLTMTGALDTTFKDTAALLNGDMINSFSIGDVVDVTGLAFTAQGTGPGQSSVNFVENGGGTAGTLSVSVGGVQKTAITLTGSYVPANFTIGTDGGTGTAVGYHA